jgi:AcrR family transcriptional regulator
MASHPARTEPRTALPSAQPQRPRGRPRLISDAHLLEVAREVFLTRGIQATAEEVAERARVSEGTIFHRFKSKDALFRAAMRFDPDALPAFVEGLARRVGKGDLRERLVHFANRMLELGRTAVPVMMMSWSNPTGEYGLEKMVSRKDGYQRAFRAVRDLFTRELAARSLREDKAELLARIFMGSLHHYCMSELFTGASSSSQSRAQFTEGLVDVLLTAAGYNTEPEARRPKARSRAIRPQE